MTQVLAWYGESFETTKTAVIIYWTTKLYGRQHHAKESKLRFHDGSILDGLVVGVCEADGRGTIGNTGLHG